MSAAVLVFDRLRFNYLEHEWIGLSIWISQMSFPKRLLYSALLMISVLTLRASAVISASFLRKIYRSIQMNSGAKKNAPLVAMIYIKRTYNQNAQEYS